MTKPLRVVVVDDSPFARAALAQLFDASEHLQVVATAGDGATAVETVARVRPDVVTMDMAMPDIDGLDAVEQIMARCPVPIVVVTALGSSARALEAVRRGALDVALKPTTPAEGEALRQLVRRAAGVPVVRHVRALRLARARVAPVGSGRARAVGHAADVRMVGIAASAGGPVAIAAVLASLPPGLPACIAVVQHLPEDFIESFAGFLRGAGGREVALLAPGSHVAARADQILVAAPGCHLVASARRQFSAISEPPVGGHRPSATLLFRSLARWQGEQAVGVILTGMGSDGAEGLVELRARGGRVIAQDEATSAVYGMPRAAFDAGAVSEVVALPDIAGAIARALQPLG